ncbi:MAG: hypothetical protein FJ138_05640 [Deltaproteobacteria bacterium]|nr:hypothetical protein [Deltaproteobacteria bacterium]
MWRSLWRAGAGAARAKLKELCAGDSLFFIFLGGQLLTSFFRIYLIRLLTTALSVGEYGQWRSAEVLGAMCLPIVTLSLPAAMGRFYFERAGDEEGRAVLIATVWRWMLGAAGLMMLVVWVVGARLGLSESEALFLLWVTPASFLKRFFEWLNRAQRNGRLYVLNQVVEVVGFSLLLWGLLSLEGAGGGAVGLWWVTVCFALCWWGVVLFNTFFYLRRGLLRPALSSLPWAEMLRLLRYSLPLSLTFFLGWLLTSFDVYTLRGLGDAQQLGYYAFAVTFSGLVSKITQASLTDWDQFFYEQKSRAAPDVDRVIARRVRLYLGCHLLGICAIKGLMPFGYLLFNAASFQEGQGLVGQLLLGNYFWLLGNLFAVGVGYVKRTWLLWVIFGVAGLFSVVCHSTLTAGRGALVGSYVTLGGFLVFALTSYIVGRRFYRFEGEMGLLGLSLVAGGGALLI